MSALVKELITSTINQEIENHPAWLGRISGLKAEKMLRGKTPYLYVLRAGELEGELDTDYYVTFVNSDLSVKHTPFIVSIHFESEEWSYENSHPGGPYTNATTIDDVLHLIMHCDKNDCVPFICSVAR